MPKVDEIFGGKIIDSAVYSLGSDIRRFLILLGVYWIYTLLKDWIRDYDFYLSQKFSNYNNINKRSIQFRRYLMFDPQRYEQKEFIKMKNTIDWNLWKIAEDSFDTILYSGLDLLSCAFVGIVLMFYSPCAVIFLILSTLPKIVSDLKFGKMVWNIWDSKGDEKIKYHRYIDSLYADKVDRFQEMKVFGYGKFLLDKSVETAKIFMDSVLKNEKKRFNFMLLVRFFQSIFYVTAMYFICLLLVNKSITVGTFYVVLGFATSFSYSFASAVKNFSQLGADYDLYYSFYKFFHLKNEIESGTVRVEAKAPEIEFKDVWFKYPKTKKWIFRGINFRLKSDEDVALVGKNGAGKSTLIKLILRTYDPQKGEILVNGTNLKELDLDSYYKLIGFLSQDFDKPEIPVEENIFLGDTEHELDESRVVEAAKLAKADEFINEYEHKYKTWLTREMDGGIAPSGGQWQRLAIARAFYRDPKFIILDEPTSAIDAIAEEEIFNNIQNYAEDKTVLIISHRFATVKKAKRIIVIDNGEIVEQGTHAELMNKDGLYKKMVEKQSH